MHPDLQEAIEFHHAIIAEGSKALVGYDTAKALANVVLLSEIPTTYDKSEQRQVNAGNLLLRGRARASARRSSASFSPPSATPSSRASRAAPTCSRPKWSASR